jgi:uncharacterized membrane protein YgcG
MTFHYFSPRIWRAASTLALGLAIFLPGTPARADVNDFSFSDFTADYYLSRDNQHISHLHVIEHLTADFPAVDQNHGILRALPKSYAGHDVNLRVKSVTNDLNAGLPYSKSTSNGNLVLKIGDAGAYVHGAQTYIITYDLDNVTAKPAGYDGFFWDINGDNWSQTFAHVTARLHLAPDLQSAYQPSRNACFTGSRGSTASDCTIANTSADPGLITAQTTGPLAAGQTLTAQIGFAPDTFAAYRITASQWLHWALLLFGLGILPLGITLWFALRRWWRYGRDPAGKGVIVPQYTPAKNVSVLEASAILNEGFRPTAISATLLDLAVRRFIKIYEVKQPGLFKAKTTYELELVKPPAGLKSEETAVIDLLFEPGAATGSRVKLSDLANKLYAGAKTIGASVNQSAADHGYFRVSPDKIDWPLITAGAVLTATCLIFASVYIIGLAICALLCFVMAKFMPARTAAGVEQRDYLLGLKQFITVAEAERIKMMQSPHGRLTEKIDTSDHAQLIKLYERLLPYAMLFGIEKQWAAQLAGLYDHDPSWYTGASNFNAGYFAGSLSSFGAASTTSFTPPASSGSGGSAGGGGGGGGGGGW